ncbi:amidase [Jiella pelagia]|uniref:Indoleacetamide hydrolase n=1 Tax=Jiella pelagia TaxID=2986949 RepID=A0ABY7BWR8_9HYPH|nr:amidase [Jiella pelagia]WAP68294.1 amidase [Jiella pelagia]
MSDPLAWSLGRAAQAIRDREISSFELTEAALERAHATQPSLNAFIEIEDETALAAAAAADEALAAGVAMGPLHGVPLAHKDMYDRKGRVTGCGSKIRKDHVAATTATVIARLDAAGQIHLGRLNMSEFAVGPTGFNAHHGRACNPLDPARITGGSSSGSGAAMASGSAFAALGSDTGGSIRIPAACCGIVGIKPTQGRVSRHGAMPLSASQDCIGPLTRTVADAELVLSLIAGADPLDPASIDAPPVERAPTVAALRIGVVRQGFFADGLDPEVAGSIVEATRILERAGASIIEAKLPPMEDVIELANLVAMSEGAAIHLDWLRQRPQEYGEQVRARLVQALGTAAPVYLRALQLRATLLARTLAETFASCDALLVPTMPTLPPISADVEVGASEAMTRVLVGLSKFTRPFSFLGLPALSVPMPATAAGLRPSAQLVAGPWQEGLLFTLGDALEREASGRSD